MTLPDAVGRSVTLWDIVGHCGTFSDTAKLLSVDVRAPCKTGVTYATRRKLSSVTTPPGGKSLRRGVPTHTKGELGPPNWLRWSRAGRAENPSLVAWLGHQLRQNKKNVRWVWDSNPRDRCPSKSPRLLGFESSAISHSANPPHKSDAAARPKSSAAVSIQPRFAIEQVLMASQLMATSDSAPVFR